MEHSNTDLKLVELIKDVLEHGYLMSLGTATANTVWVADVIYIYDDTLNIYWMSDPDSRHSEIIAKNPHVAGTITISGQGDDNLGIQFSGEAKKISGDRHDLALKHYAKRKKPAPSQEDNVLQGDFWYVLKPSRIELIHERFYGFDKQTLEV